MSGAGLAALATMLQGGSKIGLDVIADVNAGTRARNRDSVLRWSAEQSKIKKIEKDLAKAGMPLPNDPQARAAILPQFGADPSADKPVEEFLRSQDKQPVQTGPDKFYEAILEQNGGDTEMADKMVAAYRQKRDTAGLAGDTATKAQAGADLLGSGSVNASERNTKRGWSSQTADAVRPRAIDFMNTTLGREERGTADIDQQEAEIRKQYELASGYSSYLEKEDLPSMLKQIEGLSASRNSRISSDNSIRGDKTQIALGIQGSDRVMEQAFQAAEARAQEGEETRESRERIARMNEGGRNNRANANLSFKRDKALDDFVKFDAGNSLKALQAAQRNAGMIASALKGAKRPEQQAAILKGFGIKAELQKPFFGRGAVVWDESTVQAAIDEAKGSYQDAAGRLREQSRKQVGDGPAAPGKATSPRKSLSEY